MELRAKSESENMEIMQNKLNSIIKNNENLSKIVETLIDKHVPESLALPVAYGNRLRSQMLMNCKILVENNVK
jgi:hypothetical protein